VTVENGAAVGTPEELAGRTMDKVAVAAQQLLQPEDV
jgi:hypothetical protein